MTKPRNIKPEAALKGEGTLFSITNPDNGGTLGYRFEWKFDHRVFRKSFLFSVFNYNKELTKTFADSFVADFRRKLPRLYGLPLKPFYPNSINPSPHLPYGVSYHVCHDKTYDKYYLRFNVSVINSLEGTKCISLQVGDVTNITEAEARHAQNRALDIRRDFVCEFNANKKIDWNKWRIRDWVDMDTDSKFIPRNFSYVDKSLEIADVMQHGNNAAGISSRSNTFVEFGTDIDKIIDAIIKSYG